MFRQWRLPYRLWNRRWREYIDRAGTALLLPHCGNDPDQRQRCRAVLPCRYRSKVFPSRGSLIKKRAAILQKTRFGAYRGESFCRFAGEVEYGYCKKAPLLSDQQIGIGCSAMNGSIYCRIKSTLSRIVGLK